ncbi:MAG: hypothetical protein AMXMBFR47_23120 [Planctomycetota bacterium]
MVASMVLIGLRNERPQPSLKRGDEQRTWLVTNTQRVRRCREHSETVTLAAVHPAPCHRFPVQLSYAMGILQIERKYAP